MASTIGLQRFFKFTQIVCCVGLSLLVLQGCSLKEKQKVIKLGHSLDAKHPSHIAIEYMNKRLQVLSGGAMRIDIYPSGQLGSERESIELLQIGSLGMIRVSASPLEGFIPRMKVFSLPYVFDNNTHYWQVLNSDVGKSLLLDGEKFLVRGLGYFDAGSRSFYTNHTPVYTPKDLVGQKIRVMSSQTAVAMVNSMGGSATPISYSELYTSLQQGVVDGAENNPPSFYLSRHYETSKFYTLDEHTSIPDIIMISQYVWNTLTPQQQQWLQMAVDEAVDYQRKAWQQATDEAMSALVDAGVTIIRPDKKPFFDSVQSVYESQNNPEVIATVKAIREMAQ